MQSLMQILHFTNSKTLLLLKEQLVMKKVILVFLKLIKATTFLEAFYGLPKSARKKLKVTKNLNLPAIILKVNSEYLDEVTLTSRKPEIRRASDRIIFDIENTSISSGNTWDAIRMGREDHQ